MALSKKATILLCLSTSVLAELTGTSDDVTAAVEVDEAANMKMQLLQKTSVKSHTQQKEKSADDQDLTEEETIKMQYSERTWQSLVESDVEEGTEQSPEHQRRAALLAELQEIDAKVAASRTEDDAAAEENDAWTWHQHKCDNARDKNIWNNLGARHNFGADMDFCTRRCWGNDNCVSSCMKQRRNYSPACSHCFGELAACAAGPGCAWQCSNHYSSQCDRCVAQKCRPKFLLCMGDVQLRTHWLAGTDVP